MKRLVEDTFSITAKKAGRTLPRYAQTGKVSLEIAGKYVQEIAIISDKWDISEELSRTRSHLEKFNEILKEKEALGRKLDFLIQEMNREINTIASKVSDSEIRWLVVEGKTTLEKIREQVQNVE